jgi:hypothetical protein
MPGDRLDEERKHRLAQRRREHLVRRRPEERPPRLARDRAIDRVTEQAELGRVLGNVQAA